MLKTFTKLGDGLLGKLKYDFHFSYDRYEFLKDRFLQKQKDKRTLSKTIYKKLS